MLVGLLNLGILVLIFICRVLGAVLILVGLYLVVWGKSEEGKFASRKAVIPSVAESSPSTNNGKSSIFQPLLPTSSW